MSQSESSRKGKIRKFALGQEHAPTHTDAVTQMHPSCKPRGISTCGSNDLPYLAYKGFSGCVQRIVRERFIDINTRNEHGLTTGWTPLMLATEGRHIETARILIKGGADVSAVNERIESMTALHISTRNNDIAITKLLVDAGAKVGAVAARCTPLQVASDLGNLEVMEILIKAVPT